MMRPLMARKLMMAPPMLALALCLAGCAPKFERPNITVVGIEMQKANLLQQNFAVKLKVDNPNKQSLPVKGLHAELSVDGERIASGVSNHPFVVPPMGSNEFDMTVTANLALAILKFKNPHGDAIDYEVTGSADLDLPFLHDLPFHQKGSLPLKGSQ